MSEIKTDYTREELIELCEAAIVPQGSWSNDRSADAQQDVGGAWALLRARCFFRILTEPDPLTGGLCVTDACTIWLDFTPSDVDGPYVTDEGDEVFYVPTGACLAAAKGGDWLGIMPEDLL